MESAAPSASRYVSRASAGSSGSSRLAARSSSGGASLPRRCANASRAAQPLHAGALELVERAELGQREQVERGLGGAGLVLGLRRGERALGAPRGIDRQRRRALEEGGRGGQSAAGLGAVGRALELGGDVLVRSGGGLRAMPGAAIGIELRIGRLGERVVHVAPFGGRRAR